jgi:hypothetical protein
MTIQSVTVINGSAGDVGPPGPPGPSYDGTAITSNLISVGPHTFTTQKNLAYLPGARIRIASNANPDDDWMEGTVTSYGDDQLVVDSILLSPTRDGFAHADWLFNIAGEQGQQGANGLNGASGTNGNVIWHGTAAPTGTNPASPTDGDWYMQSDPANPGSTGYLWGPYNHAGTPPWGTAGLPMAQGPPGPTGAQGAQGPKGDTGTTGPQGVPGNPGPAGAQGNAGPVGPTGSGYGGTSTTSLTIASGSIGFITQPGLAYQVGTRVRLASFSSPVNYMEGNVTAYDSGGNMTVMVTLVHGSGTFGNWTLNVAGLQGDAGPPGPAGSGAGDMLAANNLSDLTNFATARNNLGLAAVAASGQYSDLSGKPPPPTQRSVTASPITVAASDEILNCNISSGSPTCQLPAAGTRAGRPVIFKDVGGQFSSHNLTLTFSGAEKADNIASLTLSSNYGYLRLVPMNDGVNTGWAIE